jgi:hypothetical protein
MSLLCGHRARAAFRAQKARRSDNQRNERKSETFSIKKHRRVIIKEEINSLYTNVKLQSVQISDLAYFGDSTLRIYSILLKNILSFDKVGFMQSQNNGTNHGYQ